jgi:hypothetical protein
LRLLEGDSAERILEAVNFYCHFYSRSSIFLLLFLS